MKSAAYNETNRMSSTSIKNRLPLLLLVGGCAGVIIAAVDNYAFEGEVSPIIIVGMLFTLSALFGAVWMWRGGLATVAAWACVPLAHVAKHVLHLPDTLQPNTYASILLLASFTFAVAAIGTGCGVLLRKLTTASSKIDHQENR
jgi:hypothetical protein